MDTQQEASRDSFDSLALARKHVRALTDGGVSREALLRALLEQEEASNSVPELPPQNAPQQLVNNSNSLSRSLSLAQPKIGSHWSVSTHPVREEGSRAPSPDQLSTSSAAHSQAGSRGSFLSTHTTATSLSDRSSTVTQFPGHELPGSKPASASTRAYWCTSCDTEFKRKFDWKRHEDEFHERYKKYPCPDCNRVFWGANTFNQHHKTRHNCKTCPHADKVIKYTRKKRAWACGFCAAFLPSMDRYIDHIGLHYESGRTKAHWYHSNVVYGLLHQPALNAAWKNIIGSRFSHIPKDQQPRYGWDPKTTGRKQGFLENETAGNLQDLLEFFQPTKDDPAHVARLAFDLADVAPANSSARNSLEMLNKGPQPPPPPPNFKREKSTTASSRRKQPGGAHKELTLAPAPAAKQRPLTQWPGIADMSSSSSSSDPAAHGDADVQMGGGGDYDTTAIPPPLFSVSPPPAQYAHHQLPPSIAISPSSDQPTFLTPTTPMSLENGGGSPFPPTNHPHLQHQASRDTVVDLLSEYMAQEQQQRMASQQEGGTSLSSMHHHHQQHLSCQQQSPYGAYDWNSICSTMVDDVASPRHNGPPLPPAPHERDHQHHHEQQQQQQQRRSDFWAPASCGESVGGGGEMYMDDVQQQPPSIHDMDGGGGRRSDVWAANSVVDYEGLGYEDEIAAAPPPANWL